MLDQDNEPLLHQESFLNYCFNRNREDVARWENWLAQHPSQKQQFEDLKRMLLLMGEDSRKRVVDTNFAALQERIAQPFMINKPKQNQFFMRWGIAATISIMVIGLAWFSYHHSMVKPNDVAVEDIVPGGNRAILILANGERVNLNAAANGALANQSGIKISKTNDGQIVYEVAQISSSESVVEFNTIETPIGGQYRVNLSDGTRVWLNAGSSLRYPLKFANAERRVELRGEGYFEVAHDPSAPFRVSSSKQVIEVLGTHFNIMAYADEKVAQTTLLEGAVRVQQSGKSTILKPGQQAQVSNGTTTVLNDVDLESVVAWKDGYFSFNESLESIMNKVSRWYGVQVVYQTNVDHSLSYSGKISRSKNISVILKNIAFDSDLHFKIEGKTVYVTK